MKKMLSFIALVGITSVFADVHPALKSAIDSKDYNKAEILVKKMNIADVYCPAELSWQNAKKIYGNYFVENPKKLDELCAPEFAQAYYEEKACSAKDEIPLCLNKLHKVPESEWAPILAKARKNGLHTVINQKTGKSYFTAPMHHLFQILDAKIESPFDFTAADAELLNEYKAVTGASSEFVNEKDAANSITQSFSSSNDVADKLILRACRLYPNIDKQYKKNIGYELFACAKTFEKYATPCAEDYEALTMSISSTLYEKDTLQYFCKDGKWLQLNEREIKFGLCTASRENERKADDTGMYLCRNSQWESVSEKEFATFDKVCDAQNENKSLPNKKINTAFVCKAGGWRYVMLDRDGNMVKSQKMGQYVWNIENVKTATPKSACPASDSKCEHSGRMYAYDAAEKVCPAGWSLPSNADWEDLLNYFAERKNTNAKQIVFGKYPSAIRDAKNAEQSLNDMAYFWSLSNGQTKDVEAIKKNADGTETFMKNSVNEPGWGFSVRCIKK